MAHGRPDGVRPAEGVRPAAGVRLAELVAALSLATDLGLGQPREHVLRQTLIAQRLAASAGWAEHQRAVFYVSQLAWVGCISDSHELAKWFGDDLLLRSDSYQVDMAGPPMARFLLSHIGSGAPPLRRLTTIGRFLASGVGDTAHSFLTHCQTTGDIAERLGLGVDVRQALAQAFERWDGKGAPARLAGERIDPVMRLVHIADDAEVEHRIAGARGALGMLLARRGTAFDPALVDMCHRHADVIFAGLDDEDAWSSALRGVVELEQPLDEAELTRALRVFADYADLKSPSRLGHSRGVAELAAGAARRLGLPQDQVTLVERAGLVHDIGIIGVSSAVWDREGPLSGSAWERVRTHPYLTERVLSRHPRLAEIGAVAGLHHERLDGSGYPRGVGGEAIPVTARLVAAADVYHALGEDRPHRPAVGAERAARVLREDVRSGRLDGESVNAVLAAAGHRVRRRPALPAGLTPREVEVLVLLARGASNKAIARRLSVSARTIGSHVEHVYTKIGVSSRGAAAVFALRHGLASGINTDRTGDDPAGADPTEGEPTGGETWDRNIG
ncbi:MAG TPA: HD domain-containing phosphohydrolase [Pseudonocardia sp.]|jgi:HD-GYP domain-containing protein (c-di-GMP phosphodiesterase class II)|uniref:HD domain-containing phosphohydrolase n=1 Tax=Pseudonocardia sp. TaxID=60912 RepID=UPI002CF6DF72|nr:HD domain-containing phosphohydrolase [Pseudonocardia sp.]HTF51168.1 HD domain-containing phosphohydrolase [Pseudonocardia sp.]